MSDSRLLQLIEAERSKFAAAALEQPAGRDAFEYGRVVGIYAGLSRAFEVIASAWDEDNANKDL